MTQAPSGRIPPHLAIIFGLTLLYLTTVLSVTLGPMQITFTDSVLALLPDALHPQKALAPHIEMIIQQVRLPRTLLAVAVGAMLAMCGTVMQGLFRNPLADPAIIGVSAGASLGAAIAIVLLGTLLQQYPDLLLLAVLPVTAFLGGTLTTLLVYRLGTNRSGTSVSMLLLAGVAMSALAGACLGLLHYFADDQALRSLSLWTMGSLSGAQWKGVILALITMTLLALYFYRDAGRLNALLLGEPEAKHMGIDVQTLKRRLILLTAAGVGITVSLAGIIGFIGLIVPHLGRLLVGPNHRILLPVSMISGALLLLIADIFARTLVAPLDMPVGIVTALIGAPFFLYLLVQQKGRL